jgi:Putative MetA-pathway of phenol degradation
MCGSFMRAALVFASIAIAGGAPRLHAQDLAPRAYLITPRGSNAITLANAYNDGPLQLEGASPIEDGTARLNAPNLTYYRAFSLFGRSANVIAGVAYGVGDFDGSLFGERVSTHRSGLFDPVVRVSVNLVGGPAMSLPEMRTWRQKTLLGVSLKVTAPTGQYDPTKLINLGTNRWAFKPELGLSRRWGNWVLDAYGGVWLYTENPEFFSRNEYFPGVQAQTADPVLVAETHLSYDVRPRLWVSLDANFWRGGTLTVNGAEIPATLQENSRVGVTASFPVTRHQSLKVSYARGAYIRFGGDFNALSMAWQYSWISGASTPRTATPPSGSSPRQE